MLADGLWGKQMAEKQPEILWDTLEFSATPSRGRGDILVISRLKAKKKNWDEYADYRVQFEINKKHDLVSHEVEILVSDAGAGGATWHDAVRRDLAVAIRDHFVKTGYYTDMARQLGWSP
jgi:hypothetical protein